MCGVHRAKARRLHATSYTLHRLSEPTPAPYPHPHPQPTHFTARHVEVHVPGVGRVAPQVQAVHGHGPRLQLKGGPLAGQPVQLLAANLLRVPR